MVELTTGLVFAALHQKFGLTPALGVFCIFCAAMIAVFWIDLDHLIIPDAISLNGIPIGVAASITGAIPGMDWKLSLFGTVLGGAVLYVPAVLYEIVRGVEGLGGGDVKLLAMMGAFLGPSGVIFVLLLSSTLGSAAGLAALIARRGSSTTPIPYGPFLTVSAVAYLFVGDRVIDFFLRTIFDQAIR
jgi:leader peptidase (prepilin peptidase)/N-methyltransferase